MTIYINSNIKWDWQQPPLLDHYGNDCDNDSDNYNDDK